MNNPSLKGKVAKTFDCPKCGLTLTQYSLGTRVRFQKCCTEEERFWLKVNKTDTCWLWTGFLNHDGYGRVGPRKGVHTGMRAHRWAWESVNGPIPAGMELMHTCDVRACVRVDHLRLGTHSENMADCFQKGRSTQGERNSHAVLNADQVREIRGLEGKERQVDIAAKFGVRPSQISHIWARRTWRHI